MLTNININKQNLSIERKLDRQRDNTQEGILRFSQYLARALKSGVRRFFLFYVNLYFDLVPKIHIDPDCYKTCIHFYYGVSQFIGL